VASMKKEEARRAVLCEYNRWAKKHPKDASMMGGFLLFRYLQEERSDLLDFRAVGKEVEEQKKPPHLLRAAC
jgi:hypothetical protein